MGLNIVLDTNAIIYLHKGVLRDPLPLARYFVSVITEMELLSYPGLQANEEQIIHELLAETTVVPLNNGVKLAAIRVRREQRLRLPDAIVAATALHVQAQLYTNDAAFRRVPDLVVQSLAVKA